MQPSACLAPLMYLYRVCVSPGYTSPPAANLLVFIYYVYVSTCLRVYVLWSVWPVYVGKVQWLKQEKQSKIYIYLFMERMEWSGMGVPVTYVRVALT
jgi:hypothetical protein